MRSKPRKTICLMLVLCISLILSGCFDDDGSGYIFKYDISGNPRTLDPQTAYDSSALLVIANIFEGLLRLDSEGNIECAVAESYTVSDDGLVYKFKLQEDIYWTDGDDFSEICTANDFVFAFQRLFKPSTKSTVEGDFFCIKNSKLINDGIISDLSLLGVKADSDFELTITLDSPNPMLPILLTTAPAMPCNADFYYSTDGKYGLYADKIASNGAFYVYNWSYDRWSTENNNFILRKNKLNNENEKVYPYGLNFFIDQPNEYSDFINGSTHSYITSGDEAVTLLRGGYSYSENDNSVWGIMFNTNGIFGNENLRKALAYATDRKNAVLEAQTYSKAYSIIPDSIQVGSLFYRDFIDSESFLKYDSYTAQRFFTNALDSTSRSDMSGLTIIMPENEILKEYLSYIMQTWQSDFSFFCNIQELSEANYKDALISGDFDFALVKLSGSYNSPSSYLTAFSRGASENYSGFGENGFQDLLAAAESASSDSESALLYDEAEKYIISKAVFIPLCYQSEYAFFAENCYDINYNPFTKTLIFRDAKCIK